MNTYWSCLIRRYIFDFLRINFMKMFLQNHSKKFKIEIYINSKIERHNHLRFYLNENLTKIQKYFHSWYGAQKFITVMFPHQFLRFFDTFECTKNLCNLGYECCCRDIVCKGCMMVSNIETHFAHNTHIFYTKYDLEIYCCSKTIRYQQF